MRDLEDTAAWTDHPSAQRVPRRDPVAEAQIAEARGPEETPMDGGLEQHVADLRAHGSVSSFEHAVAAETDATIARHAEVLASYPPPSVDVTLTGDEASHYLTLKAAAKRALEAQNAHASAGAELREAIQALCKAMAPG